LLTAGKLAGVFVGLPWNVHPLEILHCQRIGLAPVHAADMDRCERAVLQDCQMRKQVELLKHHSDLAADLVGVAQAARQLDPVDDDAPGLMFLKAVQAADQRRFSRA